MSTLTTKYELIKPSGDEDIDFQVLNQNMDKIDAHSHTVSDVSGLQSTLDNKAASRSIVTQAEAEAGTLTTVRDWTPQRVAQAIAALSMGTSVAIPTGIIVMWSGATTNVPSGWILCDGTNGTPNLRDRFIVGAGSTYAVGNTGGANTHTLTEAQLASHQHTAGITLRNQGNGISATSAYASHDSAGITGTPKTGSAGSGQAHENRPPYYALAYIMKI